MSAPLPSTAKEDNPTSMPMARWFLGKGWDATTPLKQAYPLSFSRFIVSVLISPCTGRCNLILRYDAWAIVCLAVLVLRETNRGRHFAQSKALARIWNSEKFRAYLRSLILGNTNFHCTPFSISAIVDGIRSCRATSFLQNPVCRLRWGDGILEPQGFGCSSAPRRTSWTGVS